MSIAITDNLSSAFTASTLPASEALTSRQVPKSSVSPDDKIRQANQAAATYLPSSDMLVRAEKAIEGVMLSL